jgi:hypothetical protein
MDLAHEKRVLGSNLIDERLKSNFKVQSTGSCLPSVIGGGPRSS